MSFKTILNSLIDAGVDSGTNNMPNTNAGYNAVSTGTDHALHIIDIAQTTQTGIIEGKSSNEIAADIQNKVAVFGVEGTEAIAIGQMTTSLLTKTPLKPVSPHLLLYAATISAGFSLGEAQKMAYDTIKESGGIPPTLGTMTLPGMYTYLPSKEALEELKGYLVEKKELFDNNLAEYAEQMQEFLRDANDRLISAAEDFLSFVGEGMEDYFTKNPFPPLGTAPGLAGLNALKDWFDDFNKSGKTPYADPMAIDMDGDGIETVSTDAGVHFDLDKNGFREKTGWISPDDGLLAMDRDGNGTIDNGGELFGDQTVLKDGTIASSGFEALSELDSNGDGQISVEDTQYNTLRVWQDANQYQASLNSYAPTSGNREFYPPGVVLTLAGLCPAQLISLINNIKIAA